LPTYPNQPLSQDSSEQVCNSRGAAARVSFEVHTSICQRNYNRQFSFPESGEAMNPKRKSQERSLEVEEIRLICDLRIMHSKLDELYNVVTNLKRRHQEAQIVEYSDQRALAENIARVDEIYLWFVKLKEEAERQNGELD
jgi:hypothetical protein